MSSIKDSLHDKVFQNFDKVKPDDLESEHSAEDSGRLHKVVKTNSGLTAAYSHHFMARLDHLDENTGEKESGTPRRHSTRTNTLTPYGSVKVHIRKILNHVATSSGDHIPTRSNKVTAIMYHHKPTGQQILAHLHYDGEGKPPKTILQSYGGDDREMKFSGFAKLRANNDKSKKERIEKHIHLEHVIMCRLVELMEMVSCKIKDIHLD